MTYNKANNSLTTDFNVTPYYDDYTIDSNYYRILFKPGYSVQARELTQLQTTLQNQISKIGDFLFKDGSRIVGAPITARNTSFLDRKSTRLNSSHVSESRMPSSA